MDIDTLYKVFRTPPPIRLTSGAAWEGSTANRRPAHDDEYGRSIDATHGTGQELQERGSMEASRSIPPQIPGYTLIKRLGSGSEADVYLYQQLSPARQVAIKISKNTLDPRAAVRFRSEANFMGQISTHPYILSVYENGVTVNGAATPCSNTLRAAITRRSSSMAVSPPTRCSLSASIWRARCSPRIAKASSIETSSPAIFSSTRTICPCSPISASPGPSMGVPVSASPSRGPRRRCLPKAVAVMNRPISIRLAPRCSPC